MGDLQIILYIIIGVIYVFSMVRKAIKAQNATKKPVSSASIPKSTPYQSPENKPATVATTKPIDKYSDLPKELKEKLAAAKAKQQQSKSVEKVIIPVENYEQKPVDKPVDRKVDKLVDKKQEQFTPYNLEPSSVNPYIQFLKSPEGLKAAFIASEIMQRKYE